MHKAHGIVKQAKTLVSYKTNEKLRVRSFQNLSNKSEKTFTLTQLRYSMGMAKVLEQDLYCFNINLLSFSNRWFLFCQHVNFKFASPNFFGLR